VVDLAEARTLDWRRMQHLLLAVEVVSPSSIRADRFTKRRLYQEVRVPCYWVVDPDQRTVEAWAPDDTFPTVERERVTWQPAGAGEVFVLELPSCSSRFERTVERGGGRPAGHLAPFTLKPRGFRCASLEGHMQHGLAR